MARGARHLQALTLAAAAAFCLAAKNYTYPDTDFTLQRGDLYLYPDFLSPEECERMVNILKSWSTKYGVQENPDDMKGAPGLVHEFFFPSYRPVMLPSERAFVESIRNRLVEAGNSLTIAPKAYDYNGKVYNHLTAFYKYHPGATHKLHADTDKPGRVLTGTLTLNEAGKDYEGGRLHIYKGFPKTKKAIEKYQSKYFLTGERPELINQFAGKAGTLTIFLSENLHEVMPVTSGERFVMLNWMTCYPEEEHAYDHKDLNKKIRASLPVRDENGQTKTKKKKQKQKRQKKQKRQDRRTDL